MERGRYLLAVALLAFAMQAKADGWVTDDINDILSKVRSMFTTVTGDVKDTATDFKRQLGSLTTKGGTVKEYVEDGLDLVTHRRTPFLDFVNGPGGRCGDGSVCMDFRLDLELFVVDIAQLKGRFPQIERHGLGDGTILVDIIDHLPPLTLFGLYEVLNRVPDWQHTPQNLADLFDEIGDPDAFSAEPLGAGATVKALAAGAPLNSSFNPGQASFGPAQTRLDIFCSKGKQLRDDPVRLNRVRGGWTWVANMLDGTSEFAPETVDLTLMGEGGSIPVPVKGLMKTVGKAIESIFASVDAYRANLGLCKQIETDLASCTQLVQYRTAAGNKNAYWAVRGVIHMQGDFEPQAEALLTDAANLHRLYQWQRAYKKICDAYAAII